MSDCYVEKGFQTNFYCSSKLKARTHQQSQATSVQKQATYKSERLMFNDSEERSTESLLSQESAIFVESPLLKADQPQVTASFFRPNKNNDYSSGPLIKTPITMFLAKTYMSQRQKRPLMKNFAKASMKMPSPALSQDKLNVKSTSSFGKKDQEGILQTFQEMDLIAKQLARSTDVKHKPTSKVVVKLESRRHVDEASVKTICIQFVPSQESDVYRRDSSMFLSPAIQMYTTHQFKQPKHAFNTQKVKPILTTNKESSNQWKHETIVFPQKLERKTFRTSSQIFELNLPLHPQATPRQSPVIKALISQSQEANGERVIQIAKSSESIHTDRDEGLCIYGQITGSLREKKPIQKAASSVLQNQKPLTMVKQVSLTIRPESGRSKKSQTESNCSSSSKSGYQPETCFKNETFPSLAIISQKTFMLSKERPSRVESDLQDSFSEVKAKTRVFFPKQENEIYNTKSPFQQTDYNEPLSSTTLCGKDLSSPSKMASSVGFPTWTQVRKSKNSTFSPKKVQQNLPKIEVFLKKRHPEVYLTQRHLSIGSKQPSFDTDIQVKSKTLTFEGFASKDCQTTAYTSFSSKKFISLQRKPEKSFQLFQQPAIIPKEAIGAKRVKILFKNKFIQMTNRQPPVMKPSNRLKEKDLKIQGDQQVLNEKTARDYWGCICQSQKTPSPKAKNKRVERNSTANITGFEYY